MTILYGLKSRYYKRLLAKALKQRKDVIYTLSKVPPGFRDLEMVSCIINHDYCRESCNSEKFLQLIPHQCWKQHAVQSMVFSAVRKPVLIDKIFESRISDDMKANDSVVQHYANYGDVASVLRHYQRCKDDLELRKAFAPLFHRQIKQEMYDGLDRALKRDKDVLKAFISSEEIVHLMASLSELKDEIENDDSTMDSLVRRIITLPISRSVFDGLWDSLKNDCRIIAYFIGRVSYEECRDLYLSSESSVQNSDQVLTAMLIRLKKAVINMTEKSRRVKTGKQIWVVDRDAVYETVSNYIYDSGPYGGPGPVYEDTEVLVSPEEGHYEDEYTTKKIYEDLYSARDEIRKYPTHIQKCVIQDLPPELRAGLIENA